MNLESVIFYTILILDRRYTHSIGSTWELMKWTNATSFL